MPTQKINFWVIWASILIGLILMTFTAGSGFPSGSSEEPCSPVLLIIMCSGVVLSTLIRWLVLPRFTNPQSLLTVMVVGLAFAEAAGILGAFVVSPEFPSEQRLAFIMSILAILQYIPFYASRIDNS